jgi:hypothetical protein
MRNRFLSFLALAALWSPAAGAFAQDVQMDAISRINDVNQETQVFFNKSHCDNLADTDYILTLVNFDGVTEAYLWVGGAQDNCQLNTSRNVDPPSCIAMADSKPALVEDDGNILGLRLQELTDTGVVNCENTSITGEPYELYAFRTQPPGTTDVMTAGYGVAEFRVDVVPPSELVITNAPELEGSSFTISWNSPADSENVPQYRLYASDSENPDDVTGTPIATTGQGSNSITVAAANLGLEEGEQAFLFVSAVDNAATNVGDGNEGPLSEPTLVTAAPTYGFCDDPDVDCSGCSASPMMLASGRPASGLWTLVLLLGIVLVRRLRR